MGASRKIAVILNPAAAGGRAGRQWPRFEGLLSQRIGAFETLRTRRTEEATELARRSLQEGYDLIVVVGGDGTVNEVVNGFFQDGRLVRPGATLGFLPIGTGGDLQRTLQIPVDPGGAFDVLLNGARLDLDVARARLSGYDGLPVERLFVNLLSFGMGGEVSVRAKSFPRWIGGKGAFLGATLLVFLGYRGKPVRLTIDGKPLPETFVVTNVALGNGRFHGGGMLPCPRAVMNDGLLEVTTIDRLGMWELLRDLPVLYSGEIYSHPKVRHFRAKTIGAESPEITRAEVDGEALGTLPLEVEILPERLPILIPRESPLLQAEGEQRTASQLG
jgi:YegS/Rv2252/BmrU family lipid kinase